MCSEIIISWEWAAPHHLQSVSLLKMQHIDVHFCTWLLIGWELCCTPCTSLWLADLFIVLGLNKPINLVAYKIKQLESPSIILRQQDYCSSKHCYYWWIHLHFVKHIARSCGRIVLTTEVKILWLIHIQVRNLWLSVKTSVLKSFWGWIHCVIPITLGITLGNKI